MEVPEPEKEEEEEVESSQPADETVTKEPGVLLTELQEDATATGGDAKADDENKIPVSKQVRVAFAKICRRLKCNAVMRHILY